MKISTSVADGESLEVEQLIGERESAESTLVGRLKSRTAHVAVLGLGYAGLPMAVELAKSGFPVTGLDVDEERVRLVNDGRSPVSDVADGDIAALVDASRLRASYRFGVLEEVDCALICVPTPLTADKRQDMRFVQEAARVIGSHLHPGMLVVLQSTSTPGTTTEVLLPILAQYSGLKVGEDFFVAYAPERIDPGNRQFGVGNTPKLLSGVTPQCTLLASLLFSPIVSHIVPLSSPEVAEMSKLVENGFRFINISFVNELAVLCDRMGIDIWEVIDAAATKPFAFMPHYPGPGVGGHCIPIVPFFLEAVAAEHGMVAELVRVAGRINDEMPRFVVEKLERLLAGRGKSLEQSRVLLLGVAYKADVCDYRESPALTVLRLLMDAGSAVSYYDPHVPSVDCQGTLVRSLSHDAVMSHRFDAGILLTPHSNVDYAELGRQVDFILDTHNKLSATDGATVFKM